MGYYWYDIPAENCCIAYVSMQFFNDFFVIYITFVSEYMSIVS